MWIRTLPVYSKLADESDVPLLAMYPTNELARDQETQLLTFEARDGTTGCIAFAREALLFSVALKERRVTCGGGAMIV